MILHGNCLDVLKTLEPESVQMCVTSPPYWGLRDYGVDGQIGLEDSPELFIEQMVAVFREVRRVLKKDGTLWMNLGDSYAGSSKGRNSDGIHYCLTDLQASNKGAVSGKLKKSQAEGLKPKDMVGIPWLVAFALRADGWYLRQDIIWHKPNPMPESVRDRCTKAHEYIFLFSKSERYFYDFEAIKEPVTGNAHDRGSGVNHKLRTPSGWDTGPGSHKGLSGRYKPKQNESFSAAVTGLVEKRNKRSVWTVPTHPFPEAHFATYPPALIEPCILAGSKAGDIVLDPFFGAGTTGLVAQNNERKYIGIELNPEYIKIAEKRLSGSLFSYSNEVAP
jgi:DNA modification methylase